VRSEPWPNDSDSASCGSAEVQLSEKTPPTDRQAGGHEAAAKKLPHILIAFGLLVSAYACSIALGRRFWKRARGLPLSTVSVRRGLFCLDGLHSEGFLVSTIARHRSSEQAISQAQLETLTPRDKQARHAPQLFRRGFRHRAGCGPAIWLKTIHMTCLTCFPLTPPRFAWKINKLPSKGDRRWIR
jgi:hypothetical protein